MRVLLFLIIALFSMNSLNAIDVFEEKLTLIENNNYGASGVNLSFLMNKDGNIYKYNYLVGHFSGLFENKSTDTIYPFSVRNINHKFVNENPKWSPMPYMTAYRIITGELMNVGSSIIRTVNSRGVIIFCTDNMKVCKTDDEVMVYVQNKYKILEVNKKRK